MFVALLTACGAGPVCRTDGDCGAASTCSKGACIAKPLPSPDQPFSSAPSSRPPNDTCETATPITPGRHRGTTRGATKDYLADRCAQSTANPLPNGAEVTFRARLIPQTTVKFWVESKTPGFEPRVYVASAATSCRDAIERDRECTTGFAGQPPSDVEVFVLVGSTNGVDSDFELVFEQTPVSSASGGGAAGGSPNNTAGGSAGGAAGGRPTPALTAQQVWESQADVKEIAERVKTYHVGLVRVWSQLARQASGSSANVFFGTLTETSANMYSYSATPTNRLQINRADGAQFSFAVSSIVGNIDRSDFPSRGESLSFVFRGQTANLTGSVARASASGDTTWRFQGVSWINENEAEQSTMDVSFTESSVGGGGSSSLTRRSSGSLSNSQRSLRWTVDVAAGGVWLWRDRCSLGSGHAREHNHRQPDRRPRLSL